MTPSAVAFWTAALVSLHPCPVPVPFRKDATPATPEEVSFWRRGSRRCGLFHRDRHGRVRVLKGRHPGPGRDQVLTGREEGTTWGRQHRMEAAVDGDEDASEFASLPAPVQLSWTTPTRWPHASRVKRTRPSSFRTIRHLSLGAIPEDAGAFPLLPFVSPKDPEWKGLAQKRAPRPGRTSSALSRSTRPEGPGRGGW